MSALARATYLDAGISTAGPDQLLVMLMDRLQLDVRRALEAQQLGNHDAARPQLLHAQDIVLELRGGLKVDTWSGGPALASLYDWLTRQLVKANVERDVTITQQCLTLVTGLAETWREAAALTAMAGR